MVSLTDLIRRFFCTVSKAAVGWSDQDLEWRLWKLYIHIHTFICVCLFVCLDVCLSAYLPTCLPVCQSFRLPLCHPLFVCVCKWKISNNFFCFPLFHLNNHSHKKRKDSLETRAVLMIFSLELEIFWVAVQRIY